MKEVKEWDNNPRMMWVWDNDPKDKKKMKVIYISKINDNYPVTALSDDENALIYQHCAEIEEPKKRRMTCKELNQWLLEGIRTGQYRVFRYYHENRIYSSHCYDYYDEDLPCNNDILIREDNGEWKKPLIEEGENE